MTVRDYFEFIVREIHSVVIATVNDDGLPVTCVIDIMHCDDGGLYFLTARGKNFYSRLTERSYVSLSGMKGSDTMHCTAVSVSGRVREVGNGMLPVLLKENPYMYEIYPTSESRKALTVFQIYEGSGEWFDLSKKPVERASFSFGGINIPKNGYEISEKCIGCGKCTGVCPQNCIVISGSRAFIRQENCLHCGGCAEMCPANAIAPQRGLKRE